MKRIIFFMLMALVTLCTTESYAQLNVYNQRSQQLAEERRQQEKNRFDEIIDSWNLEDYQNFINLYPRSKNVAEIKERMAEIESWKKAKQTNTIEAYNKYLKNAKFDHFEDDANRAIELLMKAEIDAAWKKATDKNTIAAYESFLSSYPKSSFANEARTRIENIKADEQWASVANSTNIPDLESFVSSYPNYSKIDTLKTRLHYLKGMKAYERGRMQEAYKEFSQVRYSDLPDSSYRTAFENVMENHSFSVLSKNSSYSDLNDFLKKYPGGRYSSEVRNYIALKKASQINATSTDSDYREALSYASGDTRKKVQEVIDANEANKREIKRQEKRLKRAQDGGLIRMGIEYLDFAWNCKLEEEGIIRYDAGINIQYGNYNDRVQAGIGVKLGILAYDLSEGTTEYSFELPLELYAKVNLFKVGAESWMLVKGKFKYNAVGNREIQRPCAWSAGLGFSGKHWDFMLYYEREIGKYQDSWYYYEPQQYIGFSLGYYFKLF